jgi:RimJ/RimL family protein N-acetyltransferase
MRLTFTPMSEADARAIAGWRYDGPYSIYNIEDEADLSEMLDRRSPHYAVYDANRSLVGFFAYGTAAEVTDMGAPTLYGEGKSITVGLGLRPDLTGQGLGEAFVVAGLDFAWRQFAPSGFRLFVLSFNQRAMRVYERAGFMRVRTVHIRNIHGERDFMEMWREA